MTDPSSPAPRVPRWALLATAACLLVPVLAPLLATGWPMGVGGVAVWLVALAPAFLLTYFLGWVGAALSLALGIAVLSFAQISLLLFRGLQPDWDLLVAVSVAYTGMCLGIGWLTGLLHRDREAAERMALTDALTGLPNRRHAQVVLDSAFGTAQRGTPVCVVLFDLDRFKEYNDRHGHAAGDEVLRVVGWILAGSTRRMNLTARYGGEEFISIMGNTEPEGALVFVARIKEELAAAELPGGPVTVSAGIAAYRDWMKVPEELVAAADRALYAAKESGRDSTRVAHDPVPLEMPSLTRRE